MLRYLVASQAFLPPEEVNFTPSLVLEEVAVVDVRVIPVVEAPLGSVEAKQNSILASAASVENAEGTSDASEFNLRKSALSTAIWD